MTDLTKYDIANKYINLTDRFSAIDTDIEGCMVLSEQIVNSRGCNNQSYLVIPITYDIFSDKVLKLKAVKLLKKVQQTICPNCPVTFWQVNSAFRFRGYTFIPLFQPIEFTILSRMLSNFSMYCYCLINYSLDTFQILSCYDSKNIRICSDSMYNQMWKFRECVHSSDIQKFSGLDITCNETHKVVQTLINYSVRLVHITMREQGLSEKQIAKEPCQPLITTVTKYIPDSFYSKIFDYLSDGTSTLINSITLDI